MSVDQRPARVKVYSSGQAATARTASFEPDQGETENGLAAGGAGALVAGGTTEAQAGGNVLVWCLAGSFLFLVGCGLGGVLLVGWLLHNGYFS